MPDDMLEDAILVSKTILDEHEFETNGVEVSFIIFIFCRRSANVIFDLFRSLRKLKHIWIKNGSHHGTYSLVNHSVATLFTKRIDSFTSPSSNPKSLSSFTKLRERK